MDRKALDDLDSGIPNVQKLFVPSDVDGHGFTFA